MNRRGFLGRLGITAASLPAAMVVGRIGADEVLAAPEEYGGFLVRRSPEGEPPYQVDENVYQRFDQRNETFSREMWDPKVIESEAPFDGVEEENIRTNKEGYTRLDYAFSSAAWTIAGAFGSGAGAIGGSNGGLYSWQPLGGPGMDGTPPWDSSDWTPEEVALIIKKAALFFGASLSGIAELDERWIYSHRFTKDFSDPPSSPPPFSLRISNHPRSGRTEPW